ncbi:MAG: mechanosensitive ion channel family protein [Patescibacteria group bacterium]
MTITNIFDYSLFNNTTWDYLIALLWLIIFLIIFKIIQSIILRKLKQWAEKTPTDIDDTVLNIITSIRPGFYVFLAFYLAVRNLDFPEPGSQIINWILIIWAVILAIKAAQTLIDYIVNKKIKTEDPSAEQALGILTKIAKASLWVLGALFVLSNMGVNVTSAMAGLGIGGIAVALALQNILSDLFSSFAIFFDKPFVAGDFIIIGDKLGTVEKIGIKTTRLRSLQGEEIVISNQELTNAQIQNFKKMAERRIVFHFGVTYDTPTKKLRQIPELVEEIINSIDGVRFDRSHFFKFEESSLDFETVYYTASADYNDYMNAQQEINLRLKDSLEKIKVDMAFPTQTIHLVK